MLFDDDETLNMYVEESLEHLSSIENDLLAIEDAGENMDEEVLNGVFRAAHSIKGGAGFMGLTVIKELSHHLENILGQMRDGQILPESDVMNVLLKSFDELQNLIQNVKNSNDANVDVFIENLISIGERESMDEPVQDITEPVIQEETEVVVTETVVTPVSDPVETVQETQPVEETVTQVPVQAVISEPVKPVQKKQMSEMQPAISQASLRVNVNLLDTLMTLAGELVLSRNQLVQGITGASERAIEASSQRIDMITSELQEAIMQTRMQPISNVFTKFNRVVRDLSKDLGKNIELTLLGKDVELDKTIIEAINDPLTHLVRNSVDHGIETPAVRKQVGKNHMGQIRLKAYHEAGQVNIEITDDGKGLNGDALADSAIAKGLITEEHARTMSSKEKKSLIFLPGFSTAKEVTDVSGRGVGMDVVKTNLDKLGGIIDIDSTVGVGTTINIKLPLTLAIIPSQIIAVGKERFAIPQVNLDELLRIPASQIKDRIEKVGDAEVVRLRGALLPLLNLSEVLDIQRYFINPKDNKEYPDRRNTVADRRSKQSPMFQENGSPEPESAEVTGSSKRIKSDRRYRSDSAINIAVVSAGTFKYGLIVDDLRDSEEIVVKPLGRHLKECSGYAGATIMGDGKVALILDVSSLARIANLSSLEGTDRVSRETERAKQLEQEKKDRASLLLFRNNEDEQLAAPLNLVERIERVKKEDIELVGGKKVVQYRGFSLPLFEISQVANMDPIPERNLTEVIVFKLAGKEIGLMVTPPIDAIETNLSIDDSTLKQPGIMGSMIINDHTTLMVDAFEMVQILNPNWFQELDAKRLEIGEDEKKILFAEDSSFFRNQVRGFLEDDGFTVIVAEDGLEAYNLLQENLDDISVVLTDLEMPNMSGFELTEKIKTTPEYSHLPVIALTSLSGEADMEKGKKVGIDVYQIKLDREKLIEVVRDYYNR